MIGDDELTAPQARTLLDVAHGDVKRTRYWHVLGARSDVLARLEDRGLVEWAGPQPGHRRGDNAFGIVTLTRAGAAAIARGDAEVA